MRVYLSLGVNIGDRAAMLDRAVRALEDSKHIGVARCSRHHETEPVGVVDQPRFLNMAVEIETELNPLELLEVVKTLETALGRVPAERWGPRAIDIDIILMGDRVVDTPELAVPHREFRNRAFVLEPLAEIAPEAVDPVTGRTVTDLRNDLLTAP
jgi:2-amino-4-hydroxy-6-hydroxymethyldihydropteridine diphosphokinase